MPTAGTPATQQPARGTRSLALLVSLLLHPFIIVPLTVLILTDARSSAVIALMTAVPLLVLIARNVRRGSWTNFDVSVRTQRAGLYWPAIALTALAAVVLYQMEASPRLVRGTVAGVVLLAISMLINRWLKVSLHMMLGAFCAVIVGWRYDQLTIPLALAFALLAWSRLELKRHTWTEVFVGAVLGCITGAFVVLG